jgi:hypothetical protein
MEITGYIHALAWRYGNSAQEGVPRSREFNADAFVIN